MYLVNIFMNSEIRQLFSVLTAAGLSVCGNAGLSGAFDQPRRQHRRRVVCRAAGRARRLVGVTFTHGATPTTEPTCGLG
jgi:hypothetical protein